MSENTIQPVMPADALAIDGGTPVRTRPLPPESPGIHWFDEEEIAQVAQVIQARSPFRFYGPDVQHMCDKLEARFRELYGVDHTLAVSSGTEAIYISLAAMDVGPGDEVLIPGYLWTSCINGIVRLGAIPRLVDIDDSFDMSPVDLERKIGPHTQGRALRPHERRGRRRPVRSSTSRGGTTSWCSRTARRPTGPR